MIFPDSIQIRKLTVLKSKSCLNPNPINVIRLYVTQIKDFKSKIAWKLISVSLCLTFVSQHHNNRHFKDVNVTTISSNAMKSQVIACKAVFLKVGGIAPLGAILMGKWAKKRRGRKFSTTN